MKNLSKTKSLDFISHETMKKDKKSYKKINAPFSYFGSKNRIARQLCENLPPHHCWVEAYCGSAAVTLAKPPSAIEFINDIDNDIANFFTQLRDNQDKLCSLVSLTPYARQELENSRIKNENDSDLERARKFLVQSMMSINGIFGSQRSGFSYSLAYTRNGCEARVNRWNNLPERLEKVVDRLKRINIENKNALDLMKSFINRPATLMYLDPPYLGDRTMGYNQDANDEKFHLKMLKQAKKAKCMIFISGYEHDIYEEVLSKASGWESKTIDTSTKDNNGKSHYRKEMIWMNKHYINALENDAVPITLTEKEKHNKSVNPVR